MPSQTTGSGLTSLIITSVRSDIGDDGATQTFTDDQYKIFIGKSASYLNMRLYNNPASGTSPIYNWSSGVGTFSDTFSDTMFSLLVMKMECLIQKRRYITSISKGIKVQDGDTLIDTSVSFGGYNNLLGNPKFGICMQVEKLIDELNRNIGGPENYGEIIWVGNRKNIQIHDHSDSYGIDQRWEILPDFDDILEY